MPAGGLKTVKNKFGERCFFSVNWPDLAHQWLPTIDHPYDKATSEFLITAPSKYQVVANGLLEETIDLRRRPARDALETIRAHRHLAGQYRGGAIRRAAFRRRRGRAARNLGASIRIATRPSPRSKSPSASPSSSSPIASARTLMRKLADVEAAGMGGGMEHASEIFFGAGVRHRPPRSEPGGARDGAPMVRRFRHRKRLGRRLAERRLRHLFRSNSPPNITRAAMPSWPAWSAVAAPYSIPRSACPAWPWCRTSRGKASPTRSCIRRAAGCCTCCAARSATDKFWAGHSRVLPALSRCQRLHGGFPRVMEETSGADLGWFFQQWVYRAGSPGG